MNRRGAVLIVVLVCLAAAGALFAVLARQALQERRSTERLLWNAQAAWLAEAGAERAAARLAVDPAYAGETWNLSPADLAGADGGAVRIRVEKVAGNPNRRKVRVEADYPDDPTHRVREIKEIFIDGAKQ